MSTEKTVGEFVSKEPVRVGGFPTLDKATYYDSKTKQTRAPANAVEEANARFRVTLLIEPGSPAHKGMEAAAIAAAKAKWPALPLKDVKFPFKLGDKLNEKAAAKRAATKSEKPQDRPEMAGKIVLYTASKFRPKLVLLTGGNTVEYKGEEVIKANLDKFYGGVMAHAELNFVANGDPDNEQFKPNVTAYINGLASTNRGEALSGRRSGADVFSQYAGLYSDTDPTEGAPGGADPADDSIPY